MEFTIEIAETEKEKWNCPEMRYKMYVEEMVVFGEGGRAQAKDSRGRALRNF